MKNVKKKDLVYKYISNNYDFETPVFIKDIYLEFPAMSKGTIRSMVKRFNEQEMLIKIDNGIYALPNKESILGETTVWVSDVVDSKYLKNSDNTRIGYRSGINFSNQLGLTSQTASVDTIISNMVSEKKREIKLKNNRLIVNAPRIQVTENNYKLMQVLDLLNMFEQYSEYGLEQSKSKLLSYISKLNLSRYELEEVVSSYPLEVQVKFYKIGGANVIT